MNSFSFLLIRPDFTIVMLSMIEFHFAPPLHHTAFFLPGHFGQTLEHRGSDGILAGIVIRRLDVSLPSVLLDYLLVAKYVL